MVVSDRPIHEGLTKGRSIIEPIDKPSIQTATVDVDPDSGSLVSRRSRLLKFGGMIIKLFVTVLNICLGGGAVSAVAVASEVE